MDLSSISSRPQSSNLADILDGRTDQVESREHAEIETAATPECEDQPADLFCEQCTDDYCSVCFFSQHKKGSRKKHISKKIGNFSEPSLPLVRPVNHNSPEPDQQQVFYYLKVQQKTVSTVPHTIKSNLGPWFADRCKYIPLRLSLNERKFLRLLESALNVSEYTDKIDIISYSSKGKRIVAQIKELCAIISGLVLAADYKTGQDLFQNKTFEENAQFFQEIFEFGRRHKIMNPDKLRSTYGKLIYMLSDSQSPEIKDMLQFECVCELKTVYKVLENKNALFILEDEVVVVATQEIISQGKTRSQIQREIRQKENAIDHLASKYSNPNINEELIKQCLYSIGDNHAFLRTNRDPCDQLIGYLRDYFKPDVSEPDFSLSIQLGKGGARLSHSHEKQYHYVYQSLSLWREIQHEMFQLWVLAENDLLSPDNIYRLRDTGQGLQRVQNAPSVSRLMHTILHRAQQKMGYWVGSSVIHLGDHNVPNAFLFIDKYTQIYRFLLPVATLLDKLPELYQKDSGIAAYIDSQFGGVEKTKKIILSDFFRHAFDGSGADNYFDAGSCIDGRLTSAWNWCSQLEKKRYFPIFLLTGFVGFDGQFN